MDGNPANLRWLYLLEELVSDEYDDTLKQKLKKCQVSLQKYPLVILKVDHCRLLEHFDEQVFEKMNARIKQEEELLGAKRKPADFAASSDEEITQQGEVEKLEDIKRVEEQSREEEIRKRKKQEAEDLRLAIQLSQSQYPQFDYCAKPSAAFEDHSNDEIPDINDSDEDNEISQKTSSFQQSPNYSRNWSDSEYDTGAPQRKKSKSNSGNSDAKTHNTNPTSSLDNFEIRDNEHKDLQPSCSFAAVRNQVPSTRSSSEESIGSPRKVFKGTKKAIKDVFAQDPIFSRYSVDISDDEDTEKMVANDFARKKMTKKVKKSSISNDGTNNESEKMQSSSSYTAVKNRIPSIRSPSEERNASPEKVVQSKKKAIKDVFAQDPIFCRFSVDSSENEDTENRPTNNTGNKKSTKKLKKSAKENGSSSRKQKTYCPKSGSGGYAILIALLEAESKPDYSGYMTKAQLCKAAQPHANESMNFSQPAQKFQYTAWTSSSTLEKKGLIVKWSNPLKVKLTDSGRALALELTDSKTRETSRGSSNFDDDAPWLEQVEMPSTSTNTKTSKPACASFSNVQNTNGFCLSSIPGILNERELINPSKNLIQNGPERMKPGHFEIMLIVDAMEVTGGSAGGKKSRKNMTTEELTALGVPYETKKLSVGAFIWIARDSYGQELVMPYIVERKRMDDLRSSIMDGRYKEQKQRICQSGIPNKIYLVEEIGRRKDIVTTNPNATNKGLNRYGKNSFLRT